MTTVIGILVTVLVFGVMIFIHEFGHYLAARLCKVTVHEFAIGMGPKIFSHVSEKTGITYSLRLLPIGGFTSMEGEDGESEDEGALNNRPRWQRFLVLVAGSAFNIISGIIVMAVYLLLTFNVASTTVAEFRDNNVSGKYGLCVGDKIVSMNNEKMVSYTDVINTISMYGTEPIDIEVERNGEKLLLEDVRFGTTLDEASGVEFGELDFLFLGIKPTAGVIFKQTFTQSFATVKVIYKSLYELITGRYGMNGVSGPIGTVTVFKEAVNTSFASVLYLFTFISINLGIMNLLPLPALDGGRIVFVIIEAITKKSVKPRVEGYIHLVGMVILLIFMAVVAFFDISKLIS